MTSLGDAYRGLPRTREVSAVRDRHLDFYRTFARRAHDARFGRERDLWADLLEAELDNMRAALTWAIDSGQGEAAQDLAASCIRLWESDRYTEGRMWLARSLAVDTQATPDQVRALLAAYELSRPREGDDFLDEAFALSEQIGDPVLRVDALRRTASRLQATGHRAEAAETFERAVELGRDVPAAAAFVAAALRGLAPIRAKAETPDGDPDEFLEALRSRLEEARRVLDAPGFEGAACVHLGLHAKELVALGDLTTPVELYTKKLALEEDPGLAATRPDTLLSFGDLQLRLGRRDEARSLWQQVIDMGPVDEGNVLRAEVSLARLDLKEANLESARQRVDRALAIARRARDPVDQYPTVWPEALGLSAELSEHAGDLVGAERALLEIVNTVPPGRRTSGVARLASIVHRSGDPARAVRLLREELEALDDPEGLLAVIVRAKLAEMEGDLDTASELLQHGRNTGFHGVRTRTSPLDPILASLTHQRGELAEARRLAEEAVAADERPAIGALSELADLALREGDAATAWAALQQILPRWPESTGWVEIVETVARAAIALGREERGAELLGLAEAERERRVLPRNGTKLAEAEAAARAAIGEELFEKAKARGRRMDLRTEMWAEARAVSEERDCD